MSPTPSILTDSGTPLSSTTIASHLHLHQRNMTAIAIVIQELLPNIITKHHVLTGPPLGLIKDRISVFVCFLLCFAFFSVFFHQLCEVLIHLPALQLHHRAVRHVSTLR